MITQLLTKKNKLNLSEEQLIQSLRNKEKIAIETLYDKYSGSLFHVIQKIVLSQEIAEDVLQEVFVKIWHSFHSFDESKGRLYTWFVNIARNLAIDKIRSKDFKNTSKNQDVEDSVNLIDSANNTRFNPEILGLKDLIKELKPEHQTILELVYFKGYTHVEVSEELNIPLGTVKTRLRMSIIILRKYFN